MQLYQNESSHPATNAQRNLMGRTHYVDPDTLRFHKSRVIMANDSCNGLIFWIVTSDALDYQNTKRGFRYVIFDVFGNVIKRHPDNLGSVYRTSAAAKKAMYEYLNTIDEYKVTAAAIAKQAKEYTREIDDANRKLAEMEKKFKGEAA